MLNYKLLTIIFIILSAQLSASTDSSNTESSFYFLGVVGGNNFSSFLYKDNEWDNNYSWGVKINFMIYDVVTLTPFMLFSRSTNIIRNLEDQYFNSDYLYLRYYDYKFDATFVDLVLLLNFKIYQVNDFVFESGFGIGYSNGDKYLSKSYNYDITDQVIRYDPNYTPGLVSKIESFQENGSGKSYYANLTVNYSRFAFSFMYTYKNMRVFEIRNLHTISFLFGINFLNIN